MRRSRRHPISSARATSSSTATSRRRSPDCACWQPLTLPSPRNRGEGIVLILCGAQYARPQERPSPRGDDYADTRISVGGVEAASTRKNLIPLSQGRGGGG